MWLSANVPSRPSAVTTRCAKMLPALLISTSTRGSSAAITDPTCLVALRLDRSAMWARCAICGATARNRPSVCSARVGSRATRMIRAPFPASDSAATFPMPDVAPVMTTTLPCIKADTSLVLAIARPQASEIGLRGLRDRHGGQAQERVRILRADRLRQRPFLRCGQHGNRVDRHLGHGCLVLAEALDGVPGPREGARILDVEVCLELLAAVDQVQPLDHMQVLGVRRPVSVD